MSILFGHPTGNPNSHQAAFAHYEASRLEALVVPWLPSAGVLRSLSAILPLRPMAARLQRRRFEPLAGVPKIQGRFGECRRLALRAMGRGDEGLSYEANDWVMRTMARACRRQSVTAVHSYEDCSLWQFEAAKRLGKACLYDMPIGYYSAWDKTQARLAREYADWLPAGGLPSSRWARPEQKRREMELADLVLAPSSFVERTIREFHPEKRIALAPYGVDLDFWTPPSRQFQDLSLSSAQLSRPRPLRFLYAGQIGIRKGIPVLLDAWPKAGLKDAELILVGTWALADAKRKMLPSGVTWLGPRSRAELRELYQSADVFVFPSFFEGLALAFLEAMACGLPVIATEVVDGMGLINEDTGCQVRSGNVEMLVEALRWFGDHRTELPRMATAARAIAKRFTWERYRQSVSQAVGSFA